MIHNNDFHLPLVCHLMCPLLSGSASTLYSVVYNMKFSVCVVGYFHTISHNLDKQDKIALLCTHIIVPVEDKPHIPT